MFKDPLMLDGAAVSPPPIALCIDSRLYGLTSSLWCNWDKNLALTT